MKKFLQFLLLILIVVVAYTFWFVNHSKPDYSGTIKLAGLTEPVDVVFDKFGIPHIYANSQTDAYYALGYLQAQERLFQMEMIRRVTTGTLSEILGNDLLETDKLFRTLSLDEKSAKFYEQFKADTGSYKSAAEAYFDGINAFIEEGPTPIEFTIIGIPKTKFSVKDAYNAVGYMSFGFADGFKTDPLSSKIAATLGIDYLQELGLHSVYDSSFIKSYLPESSAELTALTDIIDNLPIPLLNGSNSWIIGPDRSASGHPIFENDTHIAFSQPSVWFEAHLEYPGTSVYGHYLAGYPFAILGHNLYAAWGMTMFENDDVDLYREKANPNDSNQIWRVDHWENLKLRKETIPVKDAEPVEYTVRISDHGPIVNDIFYKDTDITDPVSVFWVYLQANNDLLRPTYALGQLKSMAEGRSVAASIAAPGLNIMYADVEGNIAWWAAGKLPVRPKHVDSKLFLDGSSGKDDVHEYYDFSLNPQAENPPWGYVYSANNQPDTINGVLYPGYYRPLDRASRIFNKIEEHNNWTTEEVKKMTADATSPVAKKVAEALAGQLMDSADPRIVTLATILQHWDGDHQPESIEPTVYYNLLSWVLYYAMADELGYEDYKKMANLEVMKRSYLMFVENDSSIWWDNITTPKKETRKQIVSLAANSTLATLNKVFGSDDSSTWRWGTVHTLTHGHPLGQVEALKKYFNVGPFPAPGGNEVINNQMLKLDTTGYFPVYGGPSMRTVIDMGNIYGAESINPTGQSGHFLGLHYDDQAQMYVDVEFRPQLMNKEMIMEQQAGKLLLEPIK